MCRPAIVRTRPGASSSPSRQAGEAASDRRRRLADPKDEVRCEPERACRDRFGGAVQEGRSRAHLPDRLDRGRIDRQERLPASRLGRPRDRAALIAGRQEGAVDTTAEPDECPGRRGLDRERCVAAMVEGERQARAGLAVSGRRIVRTAPEQRSVRGEEGDSGGGLRRGRRSLWDGLRASGPRSRRSRRAT